VLVIRMEDSGAGGVSGVDDQQGLPPLPQKSAAADGKDGATNSSTQLAQAAAEFLATGKLDAEVIQKLVASGQVPATLAMKVLAAKNNPEKLKEIAKGLAGPQDGPAPGLSFVKPEVTPGEPLRLEILSFLDAVGPGREPCDPGRHGRAALELALTIQATMAAHAERAGLEETGNRD
jgi:hypothetical protein